MPLAGRPFVGPEAGPGGLAQRPDAEVLGALDPVAVEVVVVGGALQGKAESVDVQLATPRGIGSDDSDARDKEDVHVRAVCPAAAPPY